MRFSVDPQLAQGQIIQATYIPSTYIKYIHYRELRFVLERWVHAEEAINFSNNDKKSRPFRRRRARNYKFVSHGCIVYR